MNKLLSLATAIFVLFSATAQASNCAAHFYKNGKWIGSQDLGMIVKSVDRKGFITQFTTLGHGENYPAYFLKSKRINADGTYNLTFKSNTKDSDGKLQTAIAEGYQSKNENTYFSIKKLTLGNRKAENVACEGQDE